MTQDLILFTQSNFSAQCGFSIVALSWAMDHGTQWHNAAYFGPMAQWTEKCGVEPDIREYTPLEHRVNSRGHSLVVSILGFCVISHFAFSVKVCFS